MKILVSICLIVGFLFACQSQRRHSDQLFIESKSTFEQTGKSSVDTLFTNFVNAIVASDSTKLAQLIVTEKEHNYLLYPEFTTHYPSATSEAMETIWTGLNNKSRKGFSRIQHRFFGKKWEYKSVQFTQEKEIYPSYEIWGGTRLVLVDSTGVDREYSLTGSVVQYNGYFKILSIKD